MGYIYYRKNKHDDSSALNKAKFNLINKMIYKNIEKIGEIETSFNDKIDNITDKTNKIDGLIEYNEKNSKLLGKFQFVNYHNSYLSDKTYQLTKNEYKKVITNVFTSYDSYFFDINIRCNGFQKTTYNYLGLIMIQIKLYKDGRHISSKNLNLNGSGDSYSKENGTEEYMFNVTTHLGELDRVFSFQKKSDYKIEIYYYNRSDRTTITFTDKVFEYAMKQYIYADINNAK